MRPSWQSMSPCLFGVVKCVSCFWALVAVIPGLNNIMICGERVHGLCKYDHKYLKLPSLGITIECKGHSILSCVRVASLGARLMFLCDNSFCISHYLYI